MTQIHTLNLCLIQRPSVNTASHSTTQPHATHTHTQRQTPSQSPTAPASQLARWPTFCQLFVPTCCQSFAKSQRNFPNILPNFCQAAVSTQVHQCFCALYFACFFWMTENPLFVFNFGLGKLDGKWPRLHKPGVKGKNKRKKEKKRLKPKKENIGKQQPSPSLSQTKNAPSGHPPPDSGQQVDFFTDRNRNTIGPPKKVKLKRPTEFFLEREKRKEKQKETHTEKTQKTEKKQK